MLKNKIITKTLDLNFNVKGPDGKDVLKAYREEEGRPKKYRVIPLKKAISNFLSNAVKHENIEDDTAWSYAQQLEENGCIQNINDEIMDNMYSEFEKNSGCEIYIKQNFKKAIIEAKKKSEQISEEEVCCDAEGENI